jgi:hypothetical protein|tara:strand:- start:276 stop:2150 length:1875 start_codon:yes stop_codon:yes gene_type:complete
MSNSGKLFDAKDIYKLRRNNEGGSKIGLFMGGATPSNTALIDKITFNGGNATDFGDLTLARNQAVGGGSDTRAVAMGGTTGGPAGYQNIIDYVQFNSTGNAADFGDLTVVKNGAAGGSNQVRAIESGGYTSSDNTTDVIDFITIASTGNATDFGNNRTVTQYTAAGAFSPTRGLLAGGDIPGSPYLSNTINYVEIATTSDSIDFGDLTSNVSNICGSSSNTIALFAGGQTPGRISTIDKVTISTLGNATDFGDLLAATNGQGDQGVSDNIRGVFAGGFAPSIQNVIQSISFTTSGTATDFGDLTVANSARTGASNCGGGLVPGESQLPSVTYMPGSGRAFIGGGDPGNSNIIQILHIPTLGNTSNFGDLTQGRYELGALGSHTRAVFGGGKYDSTIVNIIDSVEMQSQGNAADFGDLTQARHKGGALSSSTRGVWGGGQTPSNVNIIDYATIASVGNATDFGDLTAVNVGVTGLASPTRGVFIGGNDGSALNVIQYITIASTGNATDFGDTATSTVQNAGGSASETRGLSSGGYIAPGSVNNIQYITIASTGNATDFGDLTTSRSSLSATSNNIRSIAASGEETNVIDFVTIASTGNATDFGDIIANRNIMNGGTSDSHGGLQA